MSKKASAAAVSSLVKLTVEAGKASAAPPIGPALGAKGVKAIDFAKEFNAKTDHYEPGTPLPVQITVNPDRTFSFKVRQPAASYMLKRAAGITLASGAPGQRMVGTISSKHVYEIAKLKKLDMPDIDLQEVCKTVMGTAKSMGIKIVK